MSNTAGLYYIILLSAICVYLIMISLQYNLCLNYCVWPVCPDQMENNTLVDNYGNIMEIAYVAERQLQIVKNELEDYFYPNDNRVNATNLKDLLMEEGGRPVRSIILSSWLSGDDFLGNILNAHPSNFYVAKPFSYLTHKLYKNSSQTNDILDVLDSMFRCDYSSLTDYLNSTERRLQILESNIYLKKQCQLHKNYCWNVLFLSKFCKQFPFQTINLNQISLRLMERFLNHNNLGIKIVLITRDPREVMLSRKKHNKCLGDIHCLDSSILCYDMVEDYRAAVKFSKKYPDTFRIIRYEELILKPYIETEEALKFYGLYFHDHIRYYLDTSSRLKLKATSFHWRRELSFEEVEDIQRNCKLAMKLWGYLPVLNSVQQKYFNPITDYVLDDSYE